MYIFVTLFPPRARADEGCLPLIIREGRAKARGGTVGAALKRNMYYG